MLKTANQGNPADMNVRKHLQICHTNRARANDSLGNSSKAIEDWNAAIEFSSQPKGTDLLIFRAISQIGVGLTEEVNKEFDELITIPNLGGDVWYKFACAYARESIKSPDKKLDYTDRAIQLLSMAVESGWKNIDHMAADPDLAPLRERDDYKQLLEKLSKSPPPIDLKQ